MYGLYVCDCALGPARVPIIGKFQKSVGVNPFQLTFARSASSKWPDLA